MEPAKFTDESRASCGTTALSICRQRTACSTPTTVKGSQFKQPLLEFSAACAGCGETPYAKLLTQLFGDRVYWANATGCSQAWGAPFPGIPYTANKRGFGPAWTNSLFENNAELSLGLLPGLRRSSARPRSRASRSSCRVPDACGLEKPEGRRKGDSPDAAVMGAMSRIRLRGLPCRVRRLRRVAHGRRCARGGNATGVRWATLTNSARKVCEGVLKFKDQLAKKTFWMFGGDGWAYDIGFGGARPRGGKRRQRERPGGRHRGLLQHRRPELQGNACGRRRAVRGQRQEDRQEGPGRHPHELRQRLRGPGGHGRQLQPAGQGAARRPRNTTARP